MHRLRRAIRASAVGLLAGAVVLVLVPSPSAHQYLSVAYAVRVTLKGDLQNLRLVEKSHSKDTGSYADLTGLGDTYQASAGAQVNVTVTPEGWTATASSTADKPHRRKAGDEVCAMFVGSTSIPPASEPRQPACTGSAERATRAFERARLLNGAATEPPRRMGRRRHPA